MVHYYSHYCYLFGAKLLHPFFALALVVNIVYISLFLGLVLVPELGGGGI